MAVKHAFTSPKADGGDATLVRPSNWNAEHIGGSILNRDLNQISVTNNAVETSIYSFAIPANKMGSDGGVRLVISGTILVNVAGTFVIRVKLGATTFFVSGSIDLSDAPQTYKFWVELILMNSATNAQKAALLGKFIASSTSIGGADQSTVGQFSLAGYGTAAEDTTVDKTLDVTWDWSAASANLSCLKEMAVLDLIAPS